MAKMKVNTGTPATPVWVEMDAKNADTLGGKTLEEIQSSITVPLIDSNTSTSKTSAPTADALRLTNESVATAQNAAQTYADTKDTAHAADYTKHNYWAGNTTGTGEHASTNLAYQATISGVQTTGTLPDGFTFTAILNVANGVTDPLIRVNSTASYPIRRNETAPFAVGALKVGQLVTLTKVGSYFLARSALPVGTATADKVLAGYTFQSAAVPDGAVGTLSELTDMQISANNSKGNGNEIWAKTDVGYGRGVAVDAAGNVYCAHYVSTGKVIRKLDGVRYYNINI